MKLLSDLISEVEVYMQDLITGFISLVILSFPLFLAWLGAFAGIVVPLDNLFNLVGFILFWILIEFLIYLFFVNKIKKAARFKNKLFKGALAGAVLTIGSTIVAGIPFIGINEQVEKFLGVDLGYTNKLNKEDLLKLHYAKIALYSIFLTILITCLLILFFILFIFAWGN